MNIFKQINKWRSDRKTQKQIDDLCKCCKPEDINWPQYYYDKFIQGEKIIATSVDMGANWKTWPGTKWSIPEEKLQELPSREDFIRCALDAMIAEARRLNSGVMIKDGIVWPNLN